jgi:hypothetical protein
MVILGRRTRRKGRPGTMGSGMGVGVGGSSTVSPARGGRVGGNLIPTAGMMRTCGRDESTSSGGLVGVTVGVGVGTRTTATLVGKGTASSMVSGKAPIDSLGVVGVKSRFSSRGAVSSARVKSGVGLLTALAGVSVDGVTSLAKAAA